MPMTLEMPVNSKDKDFFLLVLAIQPRILLFSVSSMVQNTLPVHGDQNPWASSGHQQLARNHCSRRLLARPVTTRMEPLKMLIPSSCALDTSILIPSLKTT